MTIPQLLDLLLLCSLEMEQRDLYSYQEKWPECKIVIGGWQPPMADRSHDFLENPCFDIIVHGEGEYTFKDILLKT